MTKKCGRCQQELDQTAFNRNRASSDGLQRLCRPCQLAANRDWAERHPEVRRAMCRRREARHPRSRSIPREVKRAHNALKRAVERGDLVRPSECPACGKRDRIHAHHADYSKPLDVEWLCATCHGRLHAGTAA